MTTSDYFDTKLRELRVKQRIISIINRTLWLTEGAFVGALCIWAVKIMWG